MLRASHLYDLDVFLENAKYVGKVRDVIVDVRTGRIWGLVIPNKKVIIPYEMIKAVGDIVIVKRHPKLEGEETSADH